MKKTMLTILATVLVALGYPQQWEKVNFPLDTALKCAIYKGDTAIVFGAGKVFWADIKNWDWQNKDMPVPEDVKKCLNFKGKFYAIAGHNLLVSANGLDWQIKLTENYNFFWLFTNDKTLYIFSEGHVFSAGQAFMETSDGETFVALESLYEFLNYWQYDGNVMATCVGDTILAVAIDDGLHASRALISTDKGSSWAWFSSLDVSGIIPLDFISHYNKSGYFNFDLVGTDRGSGTAFYHLYNEDHWPDNIQQFVGYPGQLLTACYYLSPASGYEAGRWIGGYISDLNIDPIPHQGFIMAKNNYSTFQFFDYPVRCLAAGKRSAIAVGDHGQVYTSTKYGLGVEKISDLNKEVRVFPNPSAGLVTISSKNEQTAGLYDLLGRQLQRFYLPVGERQINLSDYQPGIYLLRGENSRENWQIKILKK